MSEKKKCNCGAVAAYSVAVIGAFLIVGWLVWLMHTNTQPAPLGEDRADVRRKALADTRNADAEVINNPNYVWQDKAKGVVRMPIEKAMEMSIRISQDPAKGRSNLLGRLKVAFPPPTVFD